ncbi:sulfate respiration complex iron-sulfur protein HmcB [Elusimicrobiota bacterium]
MSITRRKFLGILGAGTATAALPDITRAMQEFKGYANSLGVLHDTTRCVGCRSCEEACNEVNALPAPEASFKDEKILDATRRTNYKTFTVVNKYKVQKKTKKGEKKTLTIFRKQQCNHCLEPACASACFVSAFKKTPQGSVSYNEDVCVGCRYCMVACPFYVPTYSYNSPFDPKITKCTMCLPRILEGKLPGCVEACPAEALTFGKRDDLLKIARTRIKDHPDRYINKIYGEHDMGGTSWMYLSGVPFEKLGLPNLGKTPAPDLTHGALSAVPVVIPLWLTFLTGMYAINKNKDKENKLDKENSVESAMAKVREEESKKAAATAERLKKEKEKAVETAVKKALSEQGKNQEKK